VDAGAAFNVLHVCGKELRLESYADYPSHAVNWAAQSGNPSLAEGKSIFNRTVMGGLDQEGAILTGRRESVEEEVVRALREVGTRGFILGAGCALTKRVPSERIAWVRKSLTRTSPC
jgi:uroporphyrinogen decarboxylase